MSSITLRPHVRMPQVVIKPQQPLRFGTTTPDVQLTLEESPMLLQLLQTLESAIAQKQVMVSPYAPYPYPNDRGALKLSLAGLPVELERDNNSNKIWKLFFPTKNIKLWIYKDVATIPPLHIFSSGVRWSAPDNSILPGALQGFWAKRRFIQGLEQMDQLITLAIKQQAVTQHKTMFQDESTGTAKSALKDLLKTQIDLLTAKQDHYQPLIQNLERQYAEAQTHTETASGRERAEALREQLAKTQKEDREHRQNTLKAIAELQEKQVRLELTENNEALLRMMDESKALIRASEERMQSVGPEIDVNYETTRILLAPDTSEATARVQERVQARLAEPAPTSPSAVETAIAAASSKSRQVADSTLNGGL